MRPVDSPFPSQAACVTRARARIGQYTKGYKPPQPGAVVESVDDGLTARVRWQVTSDPRDSIPMTEQYKKSLELVLRLREQELTRQKELAESRRDRVNSGTLSQKDADQGERELTRAQRNVDDAHGQIADTDRRIAEANRQKPVTKWVGVTALRYQCWPVGVNP